MPDADILGLDPEMRAFVASHVSLNSTTARRLEQLLQAVVDQPRFGIEYESRTYTASETFRYREANCLSFTNLFIALAREAGLTVSYQEVDVPPDWTRSGDALLLNRHIDAVITGFGIDHVVDFNIRDFRTSYERRVVSDERARAHYYGNLAVEAMQARNTKDAVRYFRKTVEQDPTFTAAWVNLGSLYLRADETAYARAAWHHALAIDSNELVALSNLERLEREEGNVAAANQLLQRIRRHRMENPYYRYYLAQEAFDVQDYETAIGHLKVAVRQKKNEDRFFALMGLSYLGKGDRVTAERWITEAEHVATDENLQRNYHSKLEMLKRISG